MSTIIDKRYHIDFYTDLRFSGKVSMLAMKQNDDIINVTIKQLPKLITELQEILKSYTDEKDN